MPKLRKRRDVPSQRKRKKVQSTGSHNDHSYCMPNEEIVQSFLKEEVEVRGERVDPDFIEYTAKPSYSVCTGNFEADLMEFIPVATSVENAEGSASSHGFRDGDFEAVKDVVKELKHEASKRNMYSKDDPWKNFVGLLFDEVKVKSDLVYDKNSGELIGYCNLDKVGNQIMNFEKNMKDTSTTETDADIAKYMLVLMVRGVATDFKFPLAGFATLSITADFLYPIIWKAIRVLQTGFAQLKVLFLTCDGASANRKFFNIHRQVNEFIHYTNNPYADDERKLYFISDVPHLVKTTRNCFSN
ncbi:THAP9 [Mytilus coruscus]|uniref:THAP9 n=1 Tax=Mytilus coruscus TaxID=42192 RepID=A0A6J8A009_MYTCO|nr:THAP9 [Mytilus coruscus]